jgi:hypothetical protein
MAQSVVDDQGQYKSSCGYCRSGARTSISHGEHRIKAENLQEQGMELTKSGVLTILKQSSLENCVTLNVYSNAFHPQVNISWCPYFLTSKEKLW